MVESKAIPKKITNQDVEEMIAGIQFNYILREGLCGADLSECDMSELDFEHFKLLCYDESTHFSDEQIKRFNPMKLLELAKLPMESLREVHSKGINASGVKVAIIDTNIEQNNIRDLYGGRVEYVESQYEGEIESHGATVLDSFMQIAPNAEVQYYPLDKKDKVNKANHLFEYIKQSTQSGVKVISLSNDLENIMGDRIDEVRDYLDTNGVTLIDSPTFYRDFTYCFRDIQFDGAETYKKCLCEPEDSSHRNFWNKIVSMYQSKLKEYNLSNIADLKKQLEEKGETELLRRIIEFEPILQFEEFSEGKNSPLHFLKQREKSNELSKRNNNVEVPCGGRTLDGKYWGTSSASYTIPVIAGMFAMCKQITPQIKYEDFVTLCKEASQIIDGCNLIQPQILMDKVREKATNVEKISQTEIDRRKEFEDVSFFHDQKSTEFIKDEQGQRRYIVPAQTIGKATVHTTLEKKQEAQRVGAIDMREIEQVKEVDDVTKISIDEKEREK